MDLVILNVDINLKKVLPSCKNLNYLKTTVYKVVLKPGPLCFENFSNILTEEYLMLGIVTISSIRRFISKYVFVTLDLTLRYDLCFLNHLT